MNTQLQPARTAAFPETQIRAAISEWWRQQIKERADDPFAPAPPTGTLFEMLPAIDSLTLLEGLIVIERVLGWEVPAKCIKKGGYDSSDEMADDLVRKLRKLHSNPTPRSYSSHANQRRK